MLSVIVAVQYARENLAAIVAALNPAAQPQVDFLFCYTDADANTPGEVGAASHVRALSCAPGSLIPHLWRDGIQAARGHYVALTTAHCVPDTAWVDELLRLCRTDPVAVGGVIENDPDSDAKGWAIFLQRYIGFAPPQAARVIHEIAADNALYRRRDILAQADLLDHGFWEPSFHARFRAAGQNLQLDPVLHVWHRNRYSSGQFFRQRLAHGREFGLARALRLSPLRRFLLVVLAPLLPLVFLRKIFLAAWRHGWYRRELLRALPWLLFFLTGWGWGEARGYAESLVRTDASTYISKP
jgi:hypothetical protein